MATATRATSGRARHGRKGEETAARILDAAEQLFAERGFEAASLREIARTVGINQPGLYNYFASKKALYQAVLDRALQPMADAMAEASDSRELPGVMTDILLEHPAMASLFQQALQGDTRTVGARLVKRWLDRLFGQGLELEAVRSPERDRSELAIEIIAMFNLTTGYVLAERALASMGAGKVGDPENVARQKRLLTRFAKSRR